jgi:formate dehydrogenase subunit gamma
MPQTGDSDRPPAALVESWLANRDADLGLLRDRGFVEGWTALPDPRAGVLMQPQGRDFHRLHNEELVYGGAWVVLGVGLLLALVLVLRGRIPLAEGFSGATVLRFNWIERANHWMTAASGIVLTLTGLTLLYGRYVIRPLIGAKPYSTMASASVYLHIAFMPPFLIGVLVMVALWLRQNIPSRLDLHWLARAGGFFNNSPDKPPARRFNAGQKVMFWSAFLGMLGLALTGFTLMFPFFWGGIWVMQAAQIVHAVIALLFVAVLLGHIWIGTIGMVGAFDAMWSGRVDRNWAHEHHRLWLEKLEEEGKAPPHPAERQSTERQPAE